MKHVRKDLTNKTFGCWHVLRFAGISADGRALWFCKCTCGAKKEVRGTHLRNGKSTRCGRSGCKVSYIKHGMYGTAEYKAYWAAKGRCTQPNFIGWKDYGGRGIKFTFETFEQFFSEVGLRPSPQHSLDRWPNNEGHYAPGNVRWATRKQQMTNRRKFKCLQNFGTEELEKELRCRGVLCDD